MGQLNYGQIGGKGLSYSRQLTLHQCPRKFQLENIYNLGVRENNVTFAYGHAVAAGVQQLMAEPTNLPLAIVVCAANWDVGMYDELAADKKSLWYAVRAVELFHSLLSNPATNILKNYEIAYFVNDAGDKVPAIELTFAIRCHDGYTYEGHIDLILYNPTENSYLILELKTTKFNNLNEASYKNSNQALGYSVVLDSIVRDINASNSYYVLYLIYKSGRMEYETMLFPKNRVKRAHFINNLAIDIEIANLYADTGIYPQHGESCFDFFKPCGFIDSCNLSDDTLEALARKQTEADAAFSTEMVYDFTYDLDKIREDQLTAIEENTIVSTHELA